MRPIDIIILVVAFAVMALVFIVSIIRKKQGKSSGCAECKRIDVCSGNCAGCTSCGYKPKETPKDERK